MGYVLCVVNNMINKQDATTMPDWLEGCNETVIKNYTMQNYNIILPGLPERNMSRCEIHERPWIAETATPGEFEYSFPAGRDSALHIEISDRFHYQRYKDIVGYSSDAYLNRIPKTNFVCRCVNNACENTYESLHTLNYTEINNTVAHAYQDHLL